MDDIIDEAGLINCARMSVNIIVTKLDRKQLSEAVDVVMRAELDTREEVEHHLEHLSAHFVAMDGDKVVGVIGWYQDNVNYANEAMGDKFPGEEAYWVGFFAVEKEYRGRGIGAKLMERLEEEVSELGASEMWVSSVPETASYYVKHGFEYVMEGEIGGNKKIFMVKNWN